MPLQTEEARLDLEKETRSSEKERSGRISRRRRPKRPDRSWRRRTDRRRIRVVGGEDLAIYRNLHIVFWGRKRLDLLLNQHVNRRSNQSNWQSAPEPVR